MLFQVKIRMLNMTKHFCVNVPFKYQVSAFPEVKEICHSLFLVTLVLGFNETKKTTMQERASRKLEPTPSSRIQRGLS